MAGLIVAVVPLGAAAALEGVGNARSCPDNGYIESTDDLFIHAESWPAGEASGARVVYTADGMNWQEAVMTPNGRLGAHDWWLVNIGAFPAGTTIRFAVEVLAAGGGSAWDTNDGADYFVTVNGGAPTRWVGNTGHTPPSGQIGDGDTLTVMSESYPAGEATSARLVLSVNQGHSWSSLAMNHAGVSDGNDVWTASIGPFPAGTTNMYAIEVTYANPEEKIWDTNNGANHQIIVNIPRAGQWIGNVRHTPPSGDLDPGEDLTIHVEARPQGASAGARVVWSADGSTWQSTAMTWTGLRGSNDWWSAGIGSFAAGTIVQYAVEVDFGTDGKVWDTNYGANYLAIVNSGAPARWVGNTDHYPYDGDIDPEDDLWINTESKPVGEATSAALFYSIDGGTTWTSSPMALAGLRNGNDHWNINLGMLPAGTVVEYAVKVDYPGETIWDNRDGANYIAAVNAPAPVAWVGDTYDWPGEGALAPGGDLWINTKTGPEDAATAVNLLYSTDDGATWNDVAMNANGAEGGHDRWHRNLGGFPEGTVVRYAVYAEDALGGVRWDSNGGEDYYVRVHSPIRDVYTDKARYNPGDTVLIQVELDHAGAGSLNAEVGVTITHLFTNIAAFTADVALASGSGTNLVFAWTSPGDDFRGYGIDVDLVDGGIMRDRRSSAIDVSSDWTRFPRYGFFSDYYEGEQAWDSEAKAKELSKYHISAVQFYDWMWEHDRLIKYDCDGNMVNLFEQIDGRTQSFRTVSNKVQAAWSRNMFPMAYSLVYGDSGIGEAPAHPEWAVYTQPFATEPNLVRQHNLAGFNPPRAIWVMDVSSPEWKGFIFNQFKDAIVKMGFGGMHLDNLGGAWNYRYNSDQAVEEWNAFPAFINDCRDAIREVRPDARVIHNDVAGNYLADIARSREDVYYMEVWGNEHYRDIANVIRSARANSGGTKQVVLAAYMNLFNYSNVLSEASVRLMDAATFANGAFRIELGEGIEYLTNHYFPMHWPPARPSLLRALRTYYSFIVRNENLLFFNTLGGLTDATDAALTYSSTDALSKDAQPGTLWTVVRRWRDELDSVSLINLNGVDSDWRNRSARPPARTNVHFKYYTGKKVRNVFAATPDDGLGRPASLPFTEGSDGLGYFVEVTVPRIDYWTLLSFDMRSTVKVDGWPGDWQAAAPSTIHSVATTQGEWIYRGGADDYRTFGGAGPDADLTEVRVTSDDTYVYVLARMQDITDPSLPALGIAWRSEAAPPGSGYPWIADASTPAGSIGLEDPAQYATRQIMVYTPSGGSPTVKLWDGGIWYDPPSGDAAVAVSAADDAIEIRINRADLDCPVPSLVTMTLATFRSSGQEAGSDATFDSPDLNNDAIDLMGGDPGLTENAWGRDLNDDSIGRHYRILLDGQGAREGLEVAWPIADGQKIDLGALGVYTIVARFSETLDPVTNHFQLFIDGIRQNGEALFIRDEEPGDHRNEIRFDWTDTSIGPRLIEWHFEGNGRTLYAAREVNLNPDTDADGIPDYKEDINRDGIRQPTETSAVLVDTDGDGLADGYEDGDRDGWINGDTNRSFSHDPGELWTETDPRNADTDGDGLSDGWEAAHNLDPWDNGIVGHTNLRTGQIIADAWHGAAGDPDEDGMSNAEERRAGTDPHDAASALTIVQVRLSEGQGNELAWASVSGRQYRVFATPSLLIPFQPLNGGTIIPAHDNLTWFTDQPATRPPAEFYQLRLAE